MIDFIRAQVVGIDPKSLLERPNLSFTQEVDVRTGELKKGRLIAEFKGLRLVYYEGSGSLILLGSIHKFWNDGLHNYNDFTFADILEAQEKLFNELGLRFENLRITRLEFGVNLQIKFIVSLVLDCILMHKGKRPSMNDFSGKGNFLLFRHDRFDLKVYDKGKQYHKGSELIRIEVRHTNWTEFRKKGINTLSDVLNNGLDLLKMDLLKKWNDFLFFDLTNENPSRPEYNSVFYWEKLKGKSLTTQKKHRDQLKRMNATEGTDLQNKLALELVKKILELMNTREKKVLPLTA